jgi:hypothetical protein
LEQKSRQAEPPNPTSEVTSKEKEALPSSDSQDSEQKEEKNSPPWITPFYALRTFLDAEYSAILGYGFFVLAKQFLNLRGLLKPINASDPYDLGVFFNSLISPEAREIEAIILSIIIVFTILVDDFCRRRIMTACAPCRTMRRFSYDVTIGFFFGLAFMFLSIKSTLAWGAIGISFILSCKWARSAEIDAVEWEKCQETADPKICARVGNWKHYIARLKFLSWANLLSGCIIMAALSINMILDINKSHYNAFMVLIFLLYWICETIRFYGEHRLIKKHVENSQIQGLRGAIITIAPMPRIIQNMIKDIAMR